MLSKNYIVSSLEKNAKVSFIKCMSDPADLLIFYVLSRHLIKLGSMPPVKLRQVGIEGSCLKWVESYLTSRSQKVVTGGGGANCLLKWCPTGNHPGTLTFLSIRE